MPAKIVEVPGVGNVEFPDSMSDADIGAVIQRQHPELLKQATLSPELLASRQLMSKMEFTNNLPPSTVLSRTQGVADRFVDAIKGVAGLMPRYDEAGKPTSGPVAKVAQVPAMIGHALTVPVRYGQAVASGDYDKAANEAAGILTETVPTIAGAVDLAGRIPGATAPLRQGAADMLRQSAERSIKQVLNPTTKANKVLAGRVAPELAQRGPIALTLKGYESKLAASKSAAGEALGEAHAQVPESEVRQTKPIIDAIEQSKHEHGAIIDGVVVEPDLVAAADKLKAIVEEFGPQVSYKSLTKLRQRWDQTVAKAKGFVQQDLGASVDMKREATSAIREELAKDNPEITRLNAEYSLWANADKVVRDTVARKTGQATPLGEQLATAAGAAGGLASGGIGTALESAAIVRGLTKAFRSTAWRTISARTKSMLADAIANDRPAVVQAIADGVTATPKPPSIQDSFERFRQGPAGRIGSGLPESELNQTVDAYLNNFKDEVRGGSTEMTGKALGRSGPEAPSANYGTESARRGKGGTFKTYPELESLGLDPAVIAAAIEKGSGITYARVVQAARRGLSVSQPGTSFAQSLARSAAMNALSRRR